MTILLEPQVTQSIPTIRRESISWQTNGDMVEISIDLRNDSCDRTMSDVLVIEAAPFGAFIPNVPIARIAVGSMDPGERRTETTTVSRDTLDDLREGPDTTARNKFQSAMTALVEESSHVHWIGNLNVYFESRPGASVERHRAFGLRVPAGNTLGAMFMVKDAMDCTFDVCCSKDSWSGEILSPAPIALLCMQTPSTVGDRCHVTVEVKRTSDGRIVPVEFDFETVDGWGEAVGCVQV